MRAIRVHEFGLDVPMRVDEVEDPKPQPGEILVKARAAGLNPSDIALRSGKHPYAQMSKKSSAQDEKKVTAEKLQDAFRVAPPYIPGGEAAGEVVGWADGVEGFRKGQRVFGRTLGGGYAEVVRMDAKSAIDLPESLSFSQGAGVVVPFYSAWNALVIKAQTGPGERVLVQGGAGGVGSAAIQLAKRMGCIVFTTVSGKEKADFCRSIGADEVINYREENFAEKCKEMTGGRGVDVIIETVATDNLDKDLDAICVNGRLIIIGTGTGRGPKAEIRVPIVMTKDIRVLGLSGVNFYHMAGEVTRRFLPLFKNQGLRVHVGGEFPFSQANEAHQVLLSGKFLGKLVLVP